MEDSKELDAILEDELALLANVNTLQLRVKSAVEKREWAEFEFLNQKILSAGDKINALEDKRIALGAAAETRVTYNLKQQVKSAIYRAQWTSSAIERYIEEQRSLTSAFIEAIYPEKRGAIYSRYGKRAAADMRSLVLDDAY